MYGNFLAVDHISFEVPKGTIVGFLGPNGAGKTTTIRMLTCYMPPTSGTAMVAGHDVFHDSLKVREKIGYLAESTPLYTEMRVGEYLDFKAKLRGMTREDRQRRVAEVAARTWLQRPAAGASLGLLSKGYRQRVGIADALLHNPPVLVLDEPTVGLDPSQVREARRADFGIWRAITRSCFRPRAYFAGSGAGLSDGSLLSGAAWILWLLGTPEELKIGPARDSR